MTRRDQPVKVREAEIIISVPLSMLRELNYLSGGKLTEESELSRTSEFSAAALGRSDRVTCDKKYGRNSAKIIKPAS